MIYYRDKKYCFVELFNESTGTLVRSDVLEHGQETGQTPEMRSFPELIDIGIMGSCIAGKTGICHSVGIDCYQCGSLSDNTDMSLSEYEYIIKQCGGRVFQVALGGAGDPNKHKQFGSILRLTRETGIVPNYTTSGYQLTDEEIQLTKKYCGAVAVSYYSKLDEHGSESNSGTITAIRKFIDAGCTTNIHYVLSRKNIKEALYRVRNNLFPKGINAVIFLLYKPVGLASKNHALDFKNQDYIQLLSEISRACSDWKYGFDTCQSPAIYQHAKWVAPEVVEFCEAARFSMYIDSRCIAYPCSFGRERPEFSVDLRTQTIQEAWDSKQFAAFRNKQGSLHTIGGCRSCALGLVQNPDMAFKD